jgi:hypothetical protein
MGTVLGFVTSDTCGAVGVMVPPMYVSEEDDMPQAVRAANSAQVKPTRSASEAPLGVFNLIVDLAPVIRPTKLIPLLPHKLRRLASTGHSP